jgi:transcriptional regulator with XRE-family HTH domain
MGLANIITLTYICRSMGNTDTLPEWAVIIKRFRGLQGLTQLEFGVKYGVTQPAVAQWESGRSEPPAELLMDAMRALR